MFENNKFIRIKQLNENLKSINFTQQAFYKGHWDEQTIRARGLFVDNENNVKMRSYNKFFELNDNNGFVATELDYPVKCYKKYNGNLGLISMIDGELVFASKSEIHSEHAKELETIFNTIENKDKETIKDILRNNNVTLVFEMCSVNYKHIIDFEKSHLVLLEVVPNTLELDFFKVDKFTQYIFNKIKFVSPNIFKKELLYVANSALDLMQYIYDHKEDRIEGFVGVDTKGRMVKVKYDYYKNVKKHRTALGIYNSRGVVKEEFEEFIKFVTDNNLENEHIIDIYNQYEKRS